jgi:polyphosphate kinase 2 (PPK2 family)
MRPETRRRRASVRDVSSPKIKEPVVLESVDLKQELTKQEFKALMGGFEPRLIALQRRAIEMHIPIIVVFEGWEAAGKARLINRLLLSLDPRHFSVYSINSPTEEDLRRPFLWRFWVRTPEKGRMVIFDRSWYTRVLMDRVRKLVKPKEVEHAFDEINSFERQLADHGNVLVKLFLHISKKEQRRRFDALESDPETSWRVTKDDWIHHRNYDDYRLAAEEMLVRTNTGVAPWHVMPANDRNYAAAQVFDTVIGAVEDKIREVEDGGSLSRLFTGPPLDLPDVAPVRLSTVDLSRTVTDEEYDKKLKKYQKRLRDLEMKIYTEKLPVIVVFEGWDAAGKGGNIKRLTQNLDPRIYDVIPVFEPNDEEKSHHYLWRFWRRIPKGGHIGIFDRSWYGRVLVERVEGLCTVNEWRNAYREINEFEDQLLDSGAILVKFWLHIDQETQLRRFEERMRIPYKRWKISDEDWRNREKWDLYSEAVEEMLARTSTPYAPWTVVESNDKHYARLKALKTVIRAIEGRGLVGDVDADLEEED